MSRSSISAACRCRTTPRATASRIWLRGGSIRSLNVAVVVRRALSPAQLDQLREVVAMAVGHNKARGDAIAVYSLDQFASQVSTAQPASSVEPAEPAAAPELTTAGGFPGF